MIENLFYISFLQRLKCHGLAIDDFQLVANCYHRFVKALFGPLVV
jgi:hypothetical protein